MTDTEKQEPCYLVTPPFMQAMSEAIDAEYCNPWDQYGIPSTGFIGGTTTELMLSVLWVQRETTMCIWAFFVLSRYSLSVHLSLHTAVLHSY